MHVHQTVFNVRHFSFFFFLSFSFFLFFFFLLLYKEGAVSDMEDEIIEKEVCAMLFLV